MNILELREALVAANISQGAYWLSGGLPVEAYTIGQVGENWEVYYSERGQKAGLQTFTSEPEACTYFFNLITTDKTTLITRREPTAITRALNLLFRRKNN
ncbi:hypothetical protein [Hymenobacter sp. UV11]|uniref:hypothetical protein n=1 Tax=Hymenobacter sp. UV11 TaxID=1849735 RepID=UPI0015801626|nr:hypothetical protein [Hymenobacter sp. UV11]